MNYLRYVYLSVLTFIMMFYQNVYAMEVNSIKLFTGVTPEVIRKAAGYLAIFPDAPENAIKKMISSRKDFRRDVGQSLFEGLVKTITPSFERGYLEELPEAVKVLGSRYMDILIEDAQCNDVELQSDSTVELGAMYALLAQLKAKGIEYNPKFITKDLAIMGERQNNFLRGIIRASEKIAQRAYLFDEMREIPVDVADVFKMRIKMLAGCQVDLADSLSRIDLEHDFLSALAHAIAINGYYYDFYCLKRGSMLLHCAIRSNEQAAKDLVERMDAKYLCNVTSRDRSPLDLTQIYCREEVAKVIMEKALSEVSFVSDRFFEESLAIALRYCKRDEFKVIYKSLIGKIIQRLPVQFFNKSLGDGKGIQILLSYAAENNVPEVLNAITERKQMETLRGLFCVMRGRGTLAAGTKVL